MSLLDIWLTALTPWVLFGCFLILAGVGLTMIYTPLKRFKTLIDHDYLFLSHSIPLMADAVLHTADAIRQQPELEETLAISFYETQATIQKYKKWLEIAKDFSDKHWNKNKISLKDMAEYNNKVRKVMS